MTFFTEQELIYCRKSDCNEAKREVGMLKHILRVTTMEPSTAEDVGKLHKDIYTVYILCVALEK